MWRLPKPAPRLPGVLGYLATIAAERLRTNGPVARLAAGPRHPDADVPGREILRWRATSLLLPPALLLGTLGPTPPVRVQVLDPTLRPASRVAHLHLHNGAAFRFEDAWAEIVRARALGTFRVREGRPIEYPGFAGDERQLLYAALRLRSAAIRHVDHRGPLLSCPDCVAAPAVDLLVLGQAPALGRGEVWPVTRDEPDDDRRAAWEARQEHRHRPIPTVPEARAFATLLARVERDADPRLALAVGQYARVLTRVYRTLVMDPTTARLAAFQRAADRSRNVRPPLSHRYRPMVADDCADLDLRAVEVRAGVPDRVGEVVDLVNTVSGLCEAPEGARERRPSPSLDESALLLSLVRTARSPRTKTTRDHLSDTWRALAHSADRIVRAISIVPEHLDTLRGIDLASDERKGPLWLAAPALLAAREASRRVVDAHPTPLWPLRLTVHVGEDFDHLLSGLRAVHEPFLIGLIERGDRLGHALALGLDPEAWCSEHRLVYVRRWDRWLDLLWARRLLTSAADGGALDSVPASAFARMDREIRDIERVIRDRCAAVPLASASSESLGDSLLSVLYTPDHLARVLDGRRPFEGAEALMHDRIVGAGHSEDVLDEVLPIDTAPDLPLLPALGKQVAETVARWQCAIEVNPSSNLLIGRLRSAVAQPLFHQGTERPDAPWAVPVTLSTDDPLTFATTLGDEFAYAWAGLTLGDRPVAAGYARRWLEDAAAASWRARHSTSRSRP